MQGRTNMVPRLSKTKATGHYVPPKLRWHGGWNNTATLAKSPSKTERRETVDTRSERLSERGAWSMTRCPSSCVALRPKTLLGLDVSCVPVLTQFSCAASHRPSSALPR
eukprot:7065198-Pyramimonas_sp.AAC.1